MRVVCLLLVALLYCTKALALNVVLVNPSIPNTPFWDRVSYAAIAAAKDLDINLDIIYGGDNRIFQLDAIKAYLGNNEHPDYIVLMPYSGNAKTTFDFLEQKQIPFFTIERVLRDEEQLEVGFPKQKYKYWISEVFHDNFKAGKLLADSLYQAAKAHSTASKIKAVGITGTHNGESAQRAAGLERTVADNSSIELLQVVPAMWSRENSQRIFYKLQLRYGAIDVVWSASDVMALGILAAAKNNENNKLIHIGGFDWTKEAINEIKNGNITASVGGHFMQAAWALIKIYDYHHLFKHQNKELPNTPYYLEAITTENIDKFEFLAKKLNWDLVDFKRYSLFENKNEDYHFSVSSFTQYFEGK